MKTTYPDARIAELNEGAQICSGVASARAENRFRSLIYLRDLLFQLVSREMKVMYKRSVLGIIWTLVTPLLQLLTYSLLFCGVLGIRENHYASMAFVGLLVWNWFQTSLLMGSKCITGSTFYLLNCQFPIAVMPPSVVTTWLIHFLLALPALFGIFVLNGVSIGPTALLLPVIILLQFTFTLALAYPLAALSVSFRDTQHILTVVLNLAFVLTPIFYSIKTVPDYVRWVFVLNPMNHIVDAYRAVLIRGEQPDWLALSVLAIVTAVLLPLGYAFFKRQRFKFAEES